ncbi:MAG: EF-hand domain-containing protein [Candidatus Thermoplasmatota archaeon]|nr:EF-hand domain-containing protein [Candidatus Thermoplasmatota archaeon]
MSDENEDIPMAECGSCRAIVPVDSSECPECGISFSGVSDEALGECGACNALVPLDSTKCPECGVVFVADDVVDVLRTWMANNKMDVKTLFGRFDTNNDNMIDSGELRDGLLSLNLADLPPSQVDRLVETIDEDGDSLIDLKELQAIIGGEELDDSVPDEETSADASLEYNENVLSKVMESNGIDASEKDAFIAFAQDFNADGNTYLKKEELQAAAESWNAKSEELEEVFQGVDEAKEEDSISDEDEEVEEIDEEIEDEDEGEEVQEDHSEDEDVPDEEEVVDEIEEIEEESHDETQIDEIDEDIEEEDEEDHRETMVVRSNSEIMEQLLDIIDEQDKSLANAFGDLDDDGNRMLSADELVTKLNEILPEGLSREEADNLLESMDTDGDGNIDMVEFVNAVERHEDEIVTIEDEEAETVKTFPSEWQRRFMSKKWHDVFWPLIHTSFAIIIVGLLVNAFIPIVDGTGGMVELDIREDSFQTEWQMDDGTVVSEGEAYPCDPEIQEGECKNSLTPLAGKASSMPGGLYPDAIVALILAGCGLIWSLYTHLILAPGWRARVKAMKDVDDERAEVKEAIDEDDSEEDSEDDIEDDSSEEIEDEEEDEVEESQEESDDADDEFDIGSYVGLEIDGEDYYGTIIEFDDEEGTVVIEEDDTGDEIVGYQDEMFIPED